MSHPPFRHADRYPRLQLRLYLTSEAWLGPGKADLLEMIEETGSISEAGRRLDMSYKRAWSLVGELNRIFTTPLVRCERGGAGGGGASLTPLGREVLTRFRRIEEAAQSGCATDIAALMAGRA